MSADKEDAAVDLASLVNMLMTFHRLLDTDAWTDSERGQ